MTRTFLSGVISLGLAFLAAYPAYCQTPLATALTPDVAATQATTLIQSTETSKAATERLLQLEESEVTRLADSVEQLRQLYAEGLIARLELVKAEQDLSSARAKVGETKNQIASSSHLISEIKKSEELAKVKALVKPTLSTVNLSKTPSVVRSTLGSWSISSLSSIQQFFVNKFGRPLPTSAVGQSPTHDRLGWDHRNAVDVGVHPDSVEGRALMNYLQSAGIPFLAFRSAIPGVATGPHIHIGSPSHRIV